MIRPPGLAAIASIVLAIPAVAQNRPANPPTHIPSPPASQRALPPIPFTEFTLPNGLRVILHEDHSTPIVAVNVWYHVGSKNEELGKTGYAHLFEHMMFQGSKGFDDDYFKALQEVGGTLNGSTNSDRTNYWEVVPSNFLERAIFLEADRMATLPDALTEAKLANQREVVKNEKRQNYDNRPYGLTGARIAEMLYPKDHPYHWLTIGALEDLSAASMDDIKGFFHQYYTPNNASLAIAGDFSSAEASRLVEKHFGSIKRGPAITVPKVSQPRLNGTVRGTMEDRVAAPQLTIVWHTEPVFGPDEAALDMLAAILGQGRNSRLYRSLVYDRQIAQTANAFHNARELAGTFQVSMIARRGNSLDSLEAAANREIGALLSVPPTAAELQRAYNSLEAGFIYRLQTVGGFGGKSDQLNQYAVFTGDPGFFERDLARYRRVTPADVQRVARKYLTDNRLIFTVTAMSEEQRAAAAPPAPAGAATPGEEAEGPSESAALAASVLPAGGPDPQFTLPEVQRRKLSNGLDVVIVEHHELPVVTMNLVMKGGAGAESTDFAGLAVLTADLLDEGTDSKTALQISEALSSIGANLSTSADWDSNRLTLTTLTRQLDPALALFSDVLLNPAFREADVQRIGASRMQGLAQSRNDASAIATRIYPTLVFGPEHPYGHPQGGTEASIRAITPAALEQFHSTYYLPNNATLIVVGDVQPDRIVAKLESALGGWKPGPVPEIRVNAPPVTRERTTIYLVDRPGAAQSVINIGQVGASRTAPDYFTRLVLNQMLGGAFVSRVNLNLREDKGYTYGARTSFDLRRGAGPFLASAGVQTAVTRESVIEFLKELRGIRGEIPVTDAELDRAKQSLIRGFPRTFETPAQIAGRLGDVALFGLPDNYYDSYIAGVQKVTLADVDRLAKEAIDPSRLTILVVGDRATIEPGLRALEGIGTTITVLDPTGRPAGTAGTIQPPKD